MQEIARRRGEQGGIDEDRPGLVPPQGRLAQDGVRREERRCGKPADDSRPVEAQQVERVGAHGEVAPDARARDGREGFHRVALPGEEQGVGRDEHGRLVLQEDRRGHRDPADGVEVGEHGGRQHKAQEKEPGQVLRGDAQGGAVGDGEPRQEERRGDGRADLHQLVGGHAVQEEVLGRRPRGGEQHRRQGDVSVTEPDRRVHERPPFPSATDLIITFRFDSHHENGCPGPPHPAAGFPAPAHDPGSGCAASPSILRQAVVGKRYRSSSFPGFRDHPFPGGVM